ncbi:MAG: hypothetical protein ACYDDF_13905 [Thermoplasmatota archaeon]
MRTTGAKAGLSAVVIVAALLVLALLHPAFLTPTPPANPGANGTTNVPLSSKSASALVLQAADLGSDWQATTNRTISSNFTGFRDGYYTSLQQLSGGTSTGETVKSSAWGFNTTTDAIAYYLNQTTPTGGNNDCGAGDRSDGWEYPLGSNQTLDDCFIQKQNIVWEIGHYFGGSSPLLMSDLAAKAVAKY